MTVTAYPNVAITTDNEWAYEVFTRAIANGWSSSATGTSWSDGTTRVANAGPASAANLSANNAYYVIRFGASGRFFTWKKTTSNNALIEYTSADGTMAGGNATTPDRDATYTKIWLSTAQIYPSTGTTTTKAQTVCNNVTGAFVSILRRSPNVGGATDGCSCVFLDVYTPETWASNPDPCIGSAKFENGNVVSGVIAGYTGGSGLMSGWYKKTLSGASYVTTWWFDISRFLGCTTNADPGGTDVNFELRWITETSFAMGGKSTIFNGLQPYRNPIVGIDAGGEWGRAAFGTISVFNDGTALTS